jgi:hypothetical protein
MAQYRYDELVEKLKAEYRIQRTIVDFNPRGGNFGLEHIKQAKPDELVFLKEGTLDITGQVSELHQLHCPASKMLVLCMHTSHFVVHHVQEVIRITGHVVLNNIEIRVDVNTKNPEHRRLYHLEGNPLDIAVSKHGFSAPH